jgi:hypothetical protein
LARLYADEDFPIPVVHALRRLGHEVHTALEEGQAGRAIPDDAVLSHAVARGWAVMTRNHRHFRKLHDTVPSHRGIITITHDSDVEALAARIDHRIRATIAADGTLDGRFLRVTRPPR